MTLPLRAPRQGRGAVKAGIEALVRVERRERARIEPPQQAVHDAAGCGQQRGIAVADDDEAVALEYRRGDDARAWTAPAHRRPVHVRSIGEVERHDAGTLARRPVAIEKPIATDMATRIMTRKARRTRPKPLQSGSPRISPNTASTRMSRITASPYRHAM